MTTPHRTMAKIADRNPTLATELRKLPELKKADIRNSLNALEHFVQLYLNHLPLFDRLFEWMNGFGKAAERPFCTPLQSLFWLVMDGNHQALSTILNCGIDEIRRPDRHRKITRRPPRPPKDDRADPELSVNLAGLLDAAWEFEPRLLGDAEIRDIISNIDASADQPVFGLITAKGHALKLQKVILSTYRKHREWFDTQSRRMIDQVLPKTRWESFTLVADRLNAPELINYYINQNILYSRAAAYGPSMTFLLKKGQCTDIAYFSEFLLRRAGYRTFMRSVKWSPDPWDGLHTAAGVIQSNGQYLLVGNFSGKNRLAGPLDNLEAVDAEMAGDNAIIDRQWGAYYPLRYY